MIIKGLVLFLTFAALAALPGWPYSREWGYKPAIGVGSMLALVLLLWALHVF